MMRYVNLQPCNFLMLHLLGTGNFADMHMAEHTYLETQIALKVLHPQLTELVIEDFIVKHVI